MSEITKFYSGGLLLVDIDQYVTHYSFWMGVFFFMSLTGSFLEPISVYGHSN